jgi:hypothetical protein
MLKLAAWLVQTAGLPVVREERFTLAVASTSCVRLLPPNFDASIRYILALEASSRAFPVKVPAEESYASGY